MANKPENLKPFKKGEDPRRHKKQAGEISFKTRFFEACKRTGKDPEEVLSELIETAQRRALKGDFRFYKDIIDRIYGKETEKVNITSKGKPLPLLENLRKQE